MSQLSELKQVLQSAYGSIVAEIAHTYELTPEDYVFSVDSTLSEPYVIAIDAGYPPTLRVDLGYLATSLLLDDDKARKKFQKSIRYKLTLAVAKIPRQQRTLALVPLAQSIAMAQDAKKFVKTMFPDKIHFHIPDGHLQVTTTITVCAKELTTGMSVTLSGTNESHLRTKAIAQLTSLVQDSEILEQMVTVENFKPVYPPDRILISSNPDEDNIKYEYDSAL
jgi:hypothetical protein